MTDNDIPFKQLEAIGITVDTFEDLPEQFKKCFMRNEMTPVICARKTMPNGDIVEMPMKLLKVRNELGQTEILVFPILRSFDNDLNLNRPAFEALAKGEILHVDGHYIQRDPETNCLLKVSDKDLQLESKLKDIEKLRDIELGTEQKNRIRNGNAVELDVGGEKVTVGLDLKDPDRFKTLNGDLHEWEYQQKVIYDILHPEYVGVVKTDENRWEFQQIINSERYPESLKQKPMQAQNSGMRRS